MADTLIPVVASYTSTTPTGLRELTSAERVPGDYLGGGRQTLWIPAGAMTPSTTNGAVMGTLEQSTNRNMLKYLGFDTATQQFAQFDVVLPKQWNRGTVTFQPYWTAASGSGTAIYQLEGVATSDGDTMDVAFGTAVSSTDTFQSANLCHVAPESAAVTIAGTPAIADRVNFRVKRDVATDTLGVDARLLGIALFVTTTASTDV